MRNEMDFSPYRRSTIGFDRIFDLLESTARAEPADSFPPFDIVRDSEDSYRITLAVAGFRTDEIDIVAQNNQLTVTGRKSAEKDEAHYLHRGIATRAFERRFQLADYVQVDKASFDNGLLTIALRREIPEAMKPRRIEIGATAGAANDRLEAPAQSGKAA